MYSWVGDRTWTSAIASLATNKSVIGALRRTSLPSLIDRSMFCEGLAAPLGAAAMAGAEAVRPPRPRANAARAVPRRTRLRMVMLFILAGSHRNVGDVVAASDANDRAVHDTGDTAAACGVGDFLSFTTVARGDTGRDGPALEARDI